MQEAKSNDVKSKDEFSSHTLSLKENVSLKDNFCNVCRKYYAGFYTHKKVTTLCASSNNITVLFKSILCALRA